MLGLEEREGDQHGTLITETTIQESTACRRLRILVAEDNVVNQKVARRMLDRLGHRCDIVANGLEAVEAMRHVAYDVILMDCQMPEMDGYEATRMIRKMEGVVRQTAIIAMTAEAMKGDRERCLEAGMDDYVAKPVDRDELAAKLREHAGNRTHPDTTPEKGDSEDASTRGPGVLDTERLNAISNGDADFAREVLELFIDEGRERLVTLHEASDQQDLEVLAAQAHSIKGAAANLGAIRVRDTARLIENEAKDGRMQRMPDLLARLTRELAAVADQGPENKSPA